MIVRLYTGADGRSHFEDLNELPPDVEASAARRATEVQFRRFPVGFFSDFHNAPRRQFLITLSGQMEIGLGDGTRRRFGAGDVMLAEDLTGQGHTSRVVGNQPRVAAIIPLA